VRRASQQGTSPRMCLNDSRRGRAITHQAWGSPRPCQGSTQGVDPASRGAGGLDQTSVERQEDRQLRDVPAVSPSGWASEGQALNKEHDMTITTMTATVDVTIGGQTRLYHAFVTTASASLDAPATLTLYAGALSDVSAFAADDAAPLGNARASTPARLVLVDSAELGWQRARYKQHGDQIAPVDPVLVGLPALQHWLWQRLRVSTLSAVA